MKIVRLQEQNLSTDQAVDVLGRGGLVVGPSDTVYGLLTDATDRAAVAKLIAFKNRPTGKPISIFVDSFLMLEQQVKVDSHQKSILQQLLPGPFTVILPSRHHVFPLLLSERKTLGVRLINYPFITKLVNKFGRPITATSANLTGRKPHYQISTFLNELSSKKKQLIDLVIDAGKLPYNRPSTVVDLSQSRVNLLRRGDIVIGSQYQYLSRSKIQTKKIAQLIYKKIAEKVRRFPTAVILSGELGSGKTVFAQGMGEAIGISNIISPTYTVSYEYKVDRDGINKLIHFDLYNIDNQDDLKYIGIKEALGSGNLVLFEWGERIGKEYVAAQNQVKIIYVEIKYINQREREITVSL